VPSYTVPLNLSDNQPTTTSLVEQVSRSTMPGSSPGSGKSVTMSHNRAVWPPNNACQSSKQQALHFFTRWKTGVQGSCGIKKRGRGQEGTSPICACVLAPRAPHRMRVHGGWGLDPMTSMSQRTRACAGPREGWEFSSCSKPPPSPRHRALHVRGCLCCLAP
jgi:hypothetical protein